MKKLERVDGIEPSSLDWKSKVIPLYDTRLGYGVRGSQ